MKWLFVVLSVLMLAGCGSVDWFPESTGNDPSPNAFTFTALTAQPLGTVVYSAPVTITGNNPNGWPITISDANSWGQSKYSINGGAYTNAQGTILPNQTLTIQQTTAATLGTTTTTVVSIGTASPPLTANFLTTTVTQ